MELNCDNCKYGEREYMGDEPCLSCGKHFDRWVKTEKPINSEYPLLDKVRKLQGYEPDYGETMTTQSEGRWIEKEAVLKILSKYFA